MEYIKEIKKELHKKIFSKKCVSKKGYKQAITLLDTIKNNEEYKPTYNNLMGKILIKQAKYKEAKIYFEEELLTNPNSESAHFNLYKIYVFEHNYQEAITNLLYCKNNNKKDIGVTLPLITLKALYDINTDIEIFLNTNYQITHTTYFSYNNLENTSASNIYKEIINNWNKKNYLELKTNLIELDKIIKNNNIKIEVNTLIFITNTLINNLEKEINKKLIEHKTTNNYNNNYKDLLIKSLNLNIISTKQILNIIDNLINYNIEIANELFNYINNNNLDNYTIEVNYLKNKLTEKNIYNFLSEEQQKLYNYYITEGSIAYKNFNLNTALNYYKQGKETTNHPIFDYYIGKIYFKLRFFTPSYEYISKYEANGGEKELHALLYLWANNNYIEKNKILEIDEKAKKLFDCYDSLKNWNLPDFKKKLIPPKKEQNPDITKYKNYKKISMSENDFKPKDLVLEEFNNYSFKDQLIIIRQLYNNGNITLATTLLKQLEKSNLNSQSRQQLTSIKKLMKIKK